MNMNSGRFLVVNTNWEKLIFRPHKLDPGDTTFTAFHDARSYCWNVIINWAFTLCLWLSQTRTLLYSMTLYLSCCAEFTAAVFLCCCHATENDSYFSCDFKVHSAAVITRTDRCNRKITKQVMISTNCLLTTRCGRSSRRRWLHTHLGKMDTFTSFWNPASMCLNLSLSVPLFMTPPATCEKSQV